MYSKNDVKEFIEMLEGSSLSVLEIKNGDGSAIRLEKAISAAPAVVMQANAPASVNESAPVAPFEVTSSIFSASSTSSILSRCGNIFLISS